MTVASDGEPFPAWTGVRGIDIPAQPAARVSNGSRALHGGHQGHRVRGKDAYAVEFTAAQHHPPKPGKIGRRGEKPGVAGDTAHVARGWIVHDATEKCTG